MTIAPDFSPFTRARLQWPDHLGLARGKYVPASLAENGSAFCVTTFARRSRHVNDPPVVGRRQDVRRGV